MQELSPTSLLVLVPLLPLLGAILTVALGRRLGSKAHLPAMAGIAGAAAVAVTLLVATARDVGPARGHGAEPVRPVEMISALWQWASFDKAYAALPGSPAVLVR